MSGIAVSTTINGDDVEFLCQSEETLLDVLRDHLGLMGAKEGCGTGDCGACSVIVDGRLVCSCLVLGAEAEGRRIETIEGMANGDKLHPLQAKFSRTRRLAMRLLHTGVPDGGEVSAGHEPRSDRGTNSLRAGRKPLPLHRLRQDRACRSGRRSRDEGSMTMGFRSELLGPEVHIRRHPPGASRRGRQGNRTRALRRGFQHARAIGGAHSPKPPRPRQDQADRHFQGGGVEGRQGGDHRGGSARSHQRQFRPCTTSSTTAWRARRRSTTAMRWPRWPRSMPARPGEALDLIEVDYEVLAHVTDVDEAIKPSAPLLHDTVFTGGVEPKPTTAVQHHQSHAVRPR